MLRILVAIFFLFLSACSNPAPQVSRSQEFEPRLQSQSLYVVPFDTVMVPEEVSALLFNRFVDQLNQTGVGHGYEFIILKQGLKLIDPAWLADRDYLVGEIFAYVEEAGSSVTSIKVRSRVRLYQPGQQAATLEVSLPAESFYENDYSVLSVERRRLAEKISTELADQLLLALFGG